MIEFELDIPSLTVDGIQMRGSFGYAKEIDSTSIMNDNVVIKMLILLNTTSPRIVMK